LETVAKLIFDWEITRMCLSLKKIMSHQKVELKTNRRHKCFPNEKHSSAQRLQANFMDWMEGYGVI